MGCTSSKGAQQPTQTSAWTIAQTVNTLIDPSKTNKAEAWSAFNSWTAGESAFLDFIQKEGAERIVSIFVSALKNGGNAPVTTEIAGLMASVACRNAASTGPKQIASMPMVSPLQWMQACVNQRDCLRVLVTCFSSPVFHLETRIRCCDLLNKILTSAPLLSSPQFLHRSPPLSSPGLSSPQKAAPLPSPAESIREAVVRHTDIWAAVAGTDIHAESQDIVVAAVNVARLLITPYGSDGDSAVVQLNTGLINTGTFAAMMRLLDIAEVARRSNISHATVARAVMLLLHTACSLGPSACQAVAGANPYKPLLQTLRSLLRLPQRIEHDIDDMDALLAVQPVVLPVDDIQLILLVCHVLSSLCSLPAAQGGRAVRDTIVNTGIVPLLVAVLNVTCDDAPGQLPAASSVAVLAQAAALSVLADLVSEKSSVDHERRRELDDIEGASPLPDPAVLHEAQAATSPSTPSRHANPMNPMNQAMAASADELGRPQLVALPPHLRGGAAPRQPGEAGHRGGAAQLRNTMYSAQAVEAGAHLAYGRDAARESRSDRITPVTGLLSATGFLDHPLFHNGGVLHHRAKPAAAKPHLMSLDTAGVIHRRGSSAGPGSPIARATNPESASSFSAVARGMPKPASPALHGSSKSMTASQLARIALWNQPVVIAAEALVATSTGLALLASVTDVDSLTTLLSQGNAAESRILEVFFGAELSGHGAQEGSFPGFTSFLQRRASLMLWQFAHARAACAAARDNRARETVERLNADLYKRASGRLLTLCQLKDLTLTELEQHVEKAVQLMADTNFESHDAPDNLASPSTLTRITSVLTPPKQAQQWTDAELADADSVARRLSPAQLAKLTGVHVLMHSSGDSSKDLYILRTLIEEGLINAAADCQLPDALSLMSIAAVAAEAMTGVHPPNEPAAGTAGWPHLTPEDPHYEVVKAFLRSVAARLRAALKSADLSLRRAAWTQRMIQRLLRLAQSSSPEVLSVVCCMVISATKSSRIYGPPQLALTGTEYSSDNSAVAASSRGGGLDPAARRRAWLASVPHTSLQAVLPQRVVAPWVDNPSFSSGNEWQFAVNVADEMSAEEVTTLLRSSNLQATFTDLRSSALASGTSSEDAYIALLTEALVGLTVAPGEARAEDSAKPRKAQLVENVNPLLAAMQLHGSA